VSFPDDFETPVTGPLPAYDPSTDELSLGVPQVPAQAKAAPWLILAALGLGVLVLMRQD
jgi:hypothetical protein